MVVTREITLNTRGECDIIDITPAIEQEVAKAGMAKGVVTIFVAGSTAGLTTIEFESGVLASLTPTTVAGATATATHMSVLHCWGLH